MSTNPLTIDFILNQLAIIDSVTARRMFGEYALYCNGKVVGLVCDDILYLKITDPGKDFVGGSYQEGYAYPGAKVSLMIDQELIEDREWICELVRITAESLPFPKPKKIKKL